MAISRKISNLVLAIILSVYSCDNMKEQYPKPVNPNATKEANKLLQSLYRISGKHTLSGQHNYTMQGSYYSDTAATISGKYPVVWGSDFSFKFNKKDPDSVRRAMVKEAIKQHRNGSIITLMWHSCFPADGEPCTNETIWHRDVSDQWDDLLTPGTELNQKWLDQIDNIAGYLKILQEENIPVLWRPYHEMNGIWFWWCNKPGEDGYQKMWKMMYDRFTNHHQLNNLIWVWNANAPRDTPGDEAYTYADFYPGNDYVDILAADVYHNDYRQSHHDGLLELGKGKLIALGEVGQLPTPEILEQQPYWAWFMTWASFLWKKNTDEEIKRLYDCERVLTKDKSSKLEAGS